MALFARARSLASSHVAAARSATVGQRFITRYEQRAHIPRLHPHRLARIVLGFTLFAIGMLNVFIPGPGGSVFILGSALVLSGESRTFARLLDRGEVRFQCPIMWVIRHPIVAVVTISCLVFVSVTVVGSQLV